MTASVRGKQEERRRIGGSTRRRLDGLVQPLAATITTTLHHEEPQPAHDASALPVAAGDIRRGVFCIVCGCSSGCIHFTFGRETCNIQQLIFTDPNIINTIITNSDNVMAAPALDNTVASSGTTGVIFSTISI